MGVTYSFNSLQVKLSNNNQPIDYYTFRNYAYTNGNILFPFKEEDYVLYAFIPWIYYKENCTNCLSIEVSVTRYGFPIFPSQGIFGSSLDLNNFYSINKKYNLDTSLNEVITPICINNYFPINYYYDSINFNNTTYKDWIYEKGPSCKTIKNLPGYDLSNIFNQHIGRDEYATLQSALEDGNLLKLKKEKWYTDETYLTYCLTEENDYSSNPRCNGVMFNYCTGNLTNPKCVAWMDGTTKQSNTIGLDLYLPHCKKYLFSQECSYFSQSSLAYNTLYRDEAIKTYCENNLSDSNCLCINTKIIPNNLITQYLGPKACWLSGCTNKNLDNKYMLTEDLNTRNKCKINGCLISIGNLKLSNNSEANIDLINQCVNQNNIQQIIGYNQNDRYDYSEKLFSNILILFIPFLVFVICIIFISFFLKKNMYNKILETTSNQINNIQRK
jgi:hypothetical protein